MLRFGPFKYICWAEGSSSCGNSTLYATGSDFFSTKLKVDLVPKLEGSGWYNLISMAVPSKPTLVARSRVSLLKSKSKP